MQYRIIIKGKNGEPVNFEDAYLPGFYPVPDKLLPHLKSAWVDKHYPEWCSECGLDDCCHPIAEDGSKYCTVLFHDAIRPPWKIEDVVL